MHNIFRNKNMMYNMVEYFCEICGRSFKLKADLTRHINKKKPCELIIDYNKSDNYKCETCGYSTSIKQHYIRHKNKKKPCIKKADLMTTKILEKLDIMMQNDEKQKMKIQQLEQKIEKQKRPINCNFILNNFTNAANIEDCLADENITKDIIEKCRNMPLKDGSTYVLNSLCDIDPSIRPIHCTDISRQNYLVRSNDTWKADAKGTEINNHLNPVISSLYTDIYKEKLSTKNMTIDERLELNDKMSKELVSDNINKCAQNALKISSTKYAIKNIENVLRYEE